MTSHDRNSSFLRFVVTLCVLVLQALSASKAAWAINITVDYRYDTSNFFNTQQKRDALEAAADRYSAVITTSLFAVSLGDNSIDPRIEFTHPSLGTSFDVSSASSSASDQVRVVSGDVAEEYRGPWSIGADEWILYAGGRSLSVAGQGGSGTGLNFTTVFEDGGSHVNRGFRGSGSNNNLPMWGGYVIFDNDGSTSWHFDLNTPASGSNLDFYSVALHEVGHALGLSIGWNEWTNYSSGGQFSGPAAVAAYNADNGASLSSLSEVSASNHHWQDGAYDSYIFQNAGPNYIGTVGSGAKQDLLMEPTANTTATIKRFELTNVDVAALEDIGWSVVPTVELLPGDYNDDGTVDAADYAVWRKHVGTTTTLPNDPDGGTIGPLQYATWKSGFGNTSGSGSGSAAALPSAAPEPASLVLCGAFGMIWLGLGRFRIR